MGCQSESPLLAATSSEFKLEAQFGTALTTVGTAPGIESKLICKLREDSLPDTESALQASLPFLVPQGCSRPGEVPGCLGALLSLFESSLAFNFSLVDQHAGSYRVWLNVGSRWTRFELGRFKEVESTISALYTVPFLFERLLRPAQKSLPELVAALRGCPVEEFDLGDEEGSIAFISKHIKHNKLLLMGQRDGLLINQIRREDSKPAGFQMRVRNSYSDIASRLTKGQSDPWIVLQQAKTMGLTKLVAVLARDNYFLTELELTEQEENRLGVFQVRQRLWGWLMFYRRPGTGFLRGILCQVGDGKVVGLKQQFMRQGEIVAIAIELGPGDYLLHLEGEVLGCQVYSSSGVQTGNLITAPERWSLLNETIAAAASTSSLVHSYKCKSIRRVSGQFAGYYYYYYENKDQSFHLHERIFLKEAKAVQFLGKKLKDEVQVAVRPGSSAAVLLMVGEEEGSEYRFVARFQTMLVQQYSDRQLRMMAKRSEEREQRSVDGSLLDVQVRVLRFQGGLCYYYDNRMQNYSYVQRISLSAKNVKARGFEGDLVEIELAPKEDFLLVFEIVSPWEATEFSRTVESQITADVFHYHK